MVFSSIEFLHVFLPLTLLAYGLSPRRLSNATLLAASLLFYTWGGGQFVFVLVASVAANYALGLLAGRPGASARWRHVCVAGSVAVNLAILGTFKYANFAVTQWDAIASVLGRPPLEWTELVLPIGISFYTFQSMSYVFDVARGRAEAVKNPVDFALFVVMFPQIIAGPIVRFHEIAAQIRERRTRLEDFSAGTVRFCFGLAKKVIVADSVAVIAEAAFDAPGRVLPASAAWLGLFAYTLQIYFDFSAYSDMAIGLGRIFGFRLPENFDRPYSALSVTDFWRRWHMTLSNWFRDYLYVPLGGSRQGPLRTGLNLWLVFLLCGLWHGAAWTFLVWGAYHGALLVSERMTHRRFVADAPHPFLQRALTLGLVMLGWVVFRSADLTHAIRFYESLAGLHSVDAPRALWFALTTKNSFVLIAASAVFMLPADVRIGRLLEERSGAGFDAARLAVMLIAVPCVALLVMSGTYSPFLYFQF